MISNMVAGGPPGGPFQHQRTPAWNQGSIPIACIGDFQGAASGIEESLGGGGLVENEGVFPYRFENSRLRPEWKGPEMIFS